LGSSCLGGASRITIGDGIAVQFRRKNTRREERINCYPGKRNVWKKGNKRKRSQKKTRKKERTKLGLLIWRSTAAVLQQEAGVAAQQRGRSLLDGRRLKTIQVFTSKISTPY